MKQNNILKRLDNVVERLNKGEKVDTGEVKILWELSYVDYRDLLVNMLTNKLEVTQDTIEILDKLTAFVDCVFKHYDMVFPTQVTYVYPDFPYTYPSYPNVPVYKTPVITCTSATGKTFAD